MIAGQQEWQLGDEITLEDGYDGDAGNNVLSVSMSTVDYCLGCSDGDGDGMDDSWEIIHFGSITNCLPLDDPDNDNYTNLDEFHNKTDPHVWDVYVKIFTAVELEWNTVNGTNYQIQSSINLESNSWVNVGDLISGDDSTNITFHTTRDSDARYYRVITVPQ